MFTFESKYKDLRSMTCSLVATLCAEDQMFQTSLGLNPVGGIRQKSGILFRLLCYAVCLWLGIPFPL